jgi:signal transduction histidine kinase
MDKSDIYRVLEEDFEATFIRELIPGILHNFANPLNGIMGRSKLLQRRTEESLKKMEEQYPDAAAGMMEELQKIRNDIRSINQESELFFDMFRDVAGKFYALATKTDDTINLTQLIAAEMRFANFYLDFKHEIRKTINLDNDIPDFKGNTAELSVALWKIIRFAMSGATASRQKEFKITTENDNKYVSVFIRYSGAAMPAADVDMLMESLDFDTVNRSGSDIDQGLLPAFLLLKNLDVKINIDNEENFNIISIGFPYLMEMAKRKEI